MRLRLIMRVLLIALASGLLLSPVAARAEATRNELEWLCSQPKGSVSEVFCEAYISGFMAGAVAQQNSMIAGYPIICIPMHATGNQAVQIVEKFMRDRPETLHQPGARIVGLALLSAFPCRKPN
jgi:hypothetical protein